MLRYTLKNLGRHFRFYFLKGKGGRIFLVFDGIFNKFRHVTYYFFLGGGRGQTNAQYSRINRNFKIK